MTKAQLIELVKRNLQGGDGTPELRGRYHQREIELYISMAFDSLLNNRLNERQEYREELGLNNWKYDGLTKTYVVPILEDTVRDRRYSELPAHILSVVNNGGIRMICPVKEEQTQFFPRALTDTFLMDGLDVGQLTGMIYFNLERKNVYYSGDMDCTWENVLMKLAIKFEEFEDDDDIDIPDGKDLEIFQTVVQLMNAKRPLDNVNDNNPQQVIQ
jgi:hypothetical protein